MPTYYARKSGNINATDVWATTPSGTAAAQTFAAGDVLVANSFTITLNVNTNLGSTGEVRNDTTGGATAGGSFNLSASGVTLTANVFGGTSNTACVTASANAAIVGAITGGSNGAGVSNTGGALTVTGAVTAGNGGNGYGIQCSNFGGSVSVTGNVTGASSNGLHIFSGPPSTITVTGNVTGGVAGYGIYNNTAASVTVVGTVTGSTIAGAINNSTGTMTVTRAKGGPAAASAVGVSASTTGATSVESIEFGDLGASPTSGPIRLTDLASNVAVMYRFGTTKKNLVDANASGLMPAASDVRSGTVYNGGNSTGTCAVPAAGSVALGVPVDNTTGTAALTPAAVWNYATSAATTSGSMGERLKDAATVASTGQQLANALTPS